jgi:protein CpxP
MQNMTFSRHVAAATLAAALAATFAAAQPAFAAGQAAGPDAAHALEAGGGEEGRRGLEDGARHGFGASGPGAPGPDAPPPRSIFGRLHRLDLSEAQQDKLFAITHAAAPKERDQDKAEHKAREALRALGAAPQFDEARAAAAARQLGQAVADGALLRVRLEAQVLAMLTPEQRASLRPEHPPGPHGRP